jgi:hypothetical protein
VSGLNILVVLFYDLVLENIVLSSLVPKNNWFFDPQFIFQTLYQSLTCIKIEIDYTKSRANK